jgi:hypothetical protein
MHSPLELPVGVPSGLLLVPMPPAAPTGALPLLDPGVLSGLPPAVLDGPNGTMDDTTTGGEPGGPGTAATGDGPLKVDTPAAGGEPRGPGFTMIGGKPGVATSTGGEPGGPATAATGAEPGGPATTNMGEVPGVVATPGVDADPCGLPAGVTPTGVVGLLPGVSNGMVFSGGGTPESKINVVSPGAYLSVIRRDFSAAGDPNP